MAFAKGSYIICEGCSRQLSILSDYSAMRICDDCGRVHQKYRSTEAITVGKIPEDLSVIKIGSKGRADASPFVVTGRVRIVVDTGYYNLWSISMERTDEMAWLIDSIGEYIVAYSKTYDATSIPDLSKAGIENMLVMPDGGSYMLTVIKGLQWGYMEGEIAAIPLVMSRATVYDLRAVDGQIAFIIRTWDQPLFYLQGHSVEWEDISINGIRNIEIVGSE